MIIPAANVRHLMLREDVVQAAADGLFRVHAVATVDEAAELLTGMPAGERDALGAFPAGSFNLKVEQRLLELADQALAAAKRAERGTERTPRRRR
ncbi:MAG: hypothetical protein WBL29_13400 [Burkholderiales bacterium]